MKVRIAVWDPLPAYRRGISAILDNAGFRVEELEEPSDFTAWSVEEEKHVALVTIEAGKSAHGWRVIAQLRQLESEPIVLALLSDSTVDLYVSAIAAGATSAVARDASPDLIRQVFVEAVQGRALLPSFVITALVTQLRPVQAEDRPSDRDIEWLGALSKGTPVAELARSAGYSERAMYRMLSDLYARIGARNRTEAIVKALQNGWL
jgi:DNA-binding NarL/FixJ family response regulator